MHPEFEAVIGLEIHAQLSTDSKIFCGCKARLEEGKSVADEIPNANTCPVCSGQPGALPVLNRKVVEYAIRAGLATGCKIQPRSIFARKNYFYPDLPKGYQTSQYDQPICTGGHLDIETEKGGAKRIGITRIHLEEDAGKNVHMSGFSLVNLNRAGVPLIEIVSEPDIRTPEEAGAYMRAMHAIVTYIGVCTGDMQEGHFRCDANVSVRPKGQEELGTRTEIKNVNSFRFMEKAVAYEIERQIQLVLSGGKVVQETRTFDADKGVTLSMRSKEEAHDYRYFPDPDLIPLAVESSWVEKIRLELPELPAQKKARYMDEFALSTEDAAVITGSRVLARFFESALLILREKSEDPKKVGKPLANFITGEVMRLVKEEGIEADKSQLRPEHLADLVLLSAKNVVSSTGAKQVIGTAWQSGEPVDKIVESQGLKQVSDVSALEPLVDEVIAKFPDQVAEYRGGKDKLLGFFVGQMMKASQGKANPALLQELLKKKLQG